MPFPRLYAIVDVDVLSARVISLQTFAAELRDAGVTLLQYRNKQGSARAILNDAAWLRKICPPEGDLRLILNDRADLALFSRFDGIHVGQEDLTVKDARAIVGPNAWVGVSTHNLQQVIEADPTKCNYIAYGPIFPTATKSNPDPTVGLAGLRAARAATSKPLVAIGGITIGNCREVLDARADSVAIISGLLPKIGEPRSTGTIRRIAENFLKALGQ